MATMASQNVFQSKYQNLVSPTLESPILSVNSSQFSTGSCLDYSLCKETPDSKINVSNLSGISEEKIATPRHLFHENAVNDNSTIDTFIMDNLEEEFNNSSEINESRVTIDEKDLTSGIDAFSLILTPNKSSSVTNNIHQLKDPHNENPFNTNDNDENNNRHLSNSHKNNYSKFNSTPFKSSPITKFGSTSKRNSSHNISNFKSENIIENNNQTQFEIGSIDSQSTSSTPTKKIFDQNDFSSPKTPNNSLNDMDQKINLNQSSFSTLAKSTANIVSKRNEEFTLSPLLSPLKEISPDAIQIDNPSEYKIVSFITYMFDQQRKINVVNMRMNAINLFANFANAIKTNSLIKKCNELDQEVQIQKENCEHLTEEVNKGNEKISSMEVVIEENQQTIQTLNTSVNDLTHSVHDQSEKLEYASSQYRSSLRHMEKSLNQYKKLFDQIERSKLRRDIAFDGGLLITCLYIVNTFIVNFPIRIVSTLIRFQNRSSKKYFNFIMKSIVLLAMYISTRKIAMLYHLHNAVGGISTYFSLIATNVYDALAYRLSYKSDDSTEV